ncbi:MAG: hypothetical protein WDM76_10520 [Limisphaerales bacterium]
MKLSLFLIRQSSRGGLCLLLCSGLFSGCGRNDVKVYHVAKEELPSAPPNVMAAPDQSSMTQPAQPQLRWTLPSGWQEKTLGQMRVASFGVTNANGQTADVGVIPLPATGQEVQLVNMWREQMKLPAATNAETETVVIAEAQGKLFDIASAEPLIDGKFRARILVAMLTSGGTSWFFKMTGEDSFVASQKATFVQFLKSIRFAETATIPPGSAPAVQSDNGKSIWTVPPGWQEAPPAQFLFAKFVIANASGTAAVNISTLAGEGGGLLANANRWRGQLGLPPITQEDEFSKMVSSMDVAHGKAQIVDFTGTDSKSGKPARLIGVVVPQDGQTWFYKLMGDEPVVEQQKDAFMKFIQSANYANAR